MSTTAASTPPLSRRMAAIAAILLVAAVVIDTVIRVVNNPARLASVVVLLAVVALSGWYAVTRGGATRLVATALLGLSVLAMIAAVIIAGTGLSLILRIAGLVVALALGRWALGRDVKTLKRSELDGERVPPATRGVLIMNLKSGGGKAEKFHLADECRSRGIEPVILQPGDDLLDLARDAIASGADVIGMAGGDGSQALVASVAATAGVPMVVIPAGTRNHLALDLGIDRDDVVGALDAFGEAVERRMDLAEVNGKVFVNNVSLGLYATIVESPDYRDNKVDTALSALPQMLGPGSQPFDLRFPGPDGTEIAGAHVVQVSNGPYGTTMGTMMTRPSVDAGTLGVYAIVIPDDRSGRRFLAALATGHPERYDGFYSWSTPSFTVTSDAPIPIGLDGETMVLDSPLQFTTRPGVLRLRLAPDAIGLSPAARKVGARAFVPTLWRTALGRAA